MPAGELRIELREGGEPPPLLVVLPHGAGMPASLPDGAVVLLVSPAGVEVRVPGEEQPRAVLDSWTSVGSWRLRCPFADESSVVEMTGWGAPELRVVRGRDGKPGPSARLPREEEAEIVVGRSSECDIVLDDVSVSRRHARVVRRDSRYYLEDLWSKGGTFVGEERIDEARLLRHQDRFRVGQTTLEFFSLLDALESGDEPSGSKEPTVDEEPPEPEEVKRLEPAGKPEKGAARRRSAGRPWWENAVLALFIAALAAGIFLVVQRILGS